MDAWIDNATRRDLHRLLRAYTSVVRCYEGRPLEEVRVAVRAEVTAGEFDQPVSEDLLEQIAREVSAGCGGAP